MAEPVKKMPNPNGRKPEAKQAAASKILKRMCNGGESLKSFAMAMLESSNAELKALAKRWFHNKRANSSTPPLGLGSTRKKKGGGSGGKKR